MNDHCLLEMSNHLGVYDTINISKTCRRLNTLAKTFMFKKFSELIIDDIMFDKGGYAGKGGYALVNEVLSYVGSHVVKLTWLCLYWKNVKCFWRIINDKCKRLKHIVIEFWEEETPLNFLDFTCFENVTSLELVGCSLHPSSNFLAKFRALNHFCSRNTVLVNDLAMILRNNRNLTSCKFVPIIPNPNNGDEIDFRCFELVPKLEVLFITLPRADDYHILAKMKLKELKLICGNSTVNQLLIHLDEYECMEVLALHYVRLDTQSMNILKSKFTKLRSLRIDYNDNFGNELQQLPIGWPENLTELVLRGVRFSFDMYLATLRHLKRLEVLDLRFACYGDSDKEKFGDIDFVQQQTLKAIRHPHKFTLVLPMKIHGSRRIISLKYLIDSDKLRIVM